MANEDVNELKVGAGAFSASLVGERTIYIFVLSICLVGLVYLLFKSQTVTSEEHRAIIQGLDELVYVQTRTEKERLELNLNMPDSLRSKQSKIFDQNFKQEDRRNGNH